MCLKLENRTHLIAALRFTGILILTILVGCHGGFTDRARGTASPVLAPGALVPSPRLIVGRVLAVDHPQRFAFVDLASDAPKAALIAGTELSVRTLDLRVTGRIEVSRYIRGRTLGAKIVGGQPSPGDEVVWLAP
jgi:hypothetical protein